MKRADVSGAMPGDVAGQPAYTVRISPKRGRRPGRRRRAGMGRRPRRAAAGWRCSRSGSGSPVLELTATDVSYGSVPASALRRLAAAGREGRRPSRRQGDAGRATTVMEPPVDRRGCGRAGGAVQALGARHPGRPAAPRGAAARLARRRRRRAGDLRRDLGGIAVIEQGARPGARAKLHGRRGTAASTSARSRSTASAVRSCRPRSARWSASSAAACRYTVPARCRPPRPRPRRAGCSGCRATRSSCAGWSSATARSWPSTTST